MIHLKRIALPAGFAALAISQATAQPAAPVPVARNGEKPRNVIFILSDDHRYDFMGFTGAVPWLQTPALDRMAREGACLKNAFVTTSLSSPSRASILTGLFTHTHTVVDNQAPKPDDPGLFPAVPSAERIPHRLLRQMAHGQSGRHAPARIRPLGRIPRTGNLLQHGAEHQRRARKVRSGTLLHRHTDRPRHRFRTRQRRWSVLHLPLLQIGTRRISALTVPERDVQGRKSGLSAVVQRAGVRNPPTAQQGCGRQAARRTGLVRREPAPRLGKEPAGKLARRRLPVSRRTAVRGGLPQLLRDGDQHGRRHRAAAGFSAGRRAGRIDSW